MAAFASALLCLAQTSISSNCGGVISKGDLVDVLCAYVNTVAANAAERNESAGPPERSVVQRRLTRWLDTPSNRDICVGYANI